MKGTPSELRGFVHVPLTDLPFAKICATPEAYHNGVCYDNRMLYSKR
jgi:hypothetical protein